MLHTGGTELLHLRQEACQQLPAEESVSMRSVGRAGKSPLLLCACVSLYERQLSWVGLARCSVSCWEHKPAPASCIFVGRGTD